MPSMRSAICGLILCGVAALAVAADKPPPAEKRFALPAGKSLVIQWSAGWTDIAPPPGTPAGTVTFSGPDPAKMRVMLVPLPPDPNFTGDDGNLRILAGNIARELENSGGEVDQQQKSIEGPNARGLYVKGVDHSPKPGEFTFIYAGPLSIDKRAYIFQILWNVGGEAAASNALAALKSVSIQ